VSTPVLVTGAPGNVGTPPVPELARAGTSVRVAAWDPQGAESAFADLDGIEVVRSHSPILRSSVHSRGSSGCSSCDRRRSPT
jgi:nucleoside-diphosphate-sugar epimerase